MMRTIKTLAKEKRMREAKQGEESSEQKAKERG